MNLQRLTIYLILLLVMAGSVVNYAVATALPVSEQPKVRNTDWDIQMSWGAVGSIVTIMACLSAGTWFTVAWMISSNEHKLRLHISNEVGKLWQNIADPTKGFITVRDCSLHMELAERTQQLANERARQRENDAREARETGD